MDKVLILNASPRAPRSNSKEYAKLFSKFYHGKTEYLDIKRTNHAALIEKLSDFSDLLFVFPLYADSIPVTLLNFLKDLEQVTPARKPTISVLINCGFIEPQQNDIAVEMMRLFCRENSYPFGSVLKIGSGEAILSTPFQVFLNAKVKKLAHSIFLHRYQVFQVTMPIPKRMFLKASSIYWEEYGKRNGCSKEKMQTMLIEGK